ncbi:MAG: serpin family protein [Salinivirgaceae bacterium]
MKTSNWLLFAVASLLVSLACTDQPVNPDTDSYSYKKTALIEQNNRFSLQLFSEITKNEPTETNVFVSPLSMYYALAMAGIGSDTETREEFEALLGWENRTEEEVLELMLNLYTELMPQDNKLTLAIANSLWQRTGFPVFDSYKDTVQKYFDAEIQSLDFNDPQAVAIINAWIEDKTRGLIPDMLDQLSPEALMYLINAIYFKGDWKYVFDPDDNLQAPFYKADGSSASVTYMNQKTYLNYLKNDWFTAVQLPYTDSSYCMTLLLPEPEVGIDGLITDLNGENWNSWAKAYQMVAVTVSLPKFTFAYGLRNINQELNDLGLVSAFNPIAADFSKITDQQINISRVLHKAFIEVNEQGSEAAAATVVEYVNTSIGNELTLILNRPFVFAIEHKPTQTLLFLGKMAIPKY